MNPDKKNSLWLALQFSSTIVISLITLKLNLTHYGEKLFGIWILISSLWGFSNVLDFGMGTAILRFVARLKDQDEKQVNILLSSTFFVFIILGILIFLVMYLIAEFVYFGNKNIVPQIFQNPMKISFLFLGVGFYIRYISLFFKSFIEGMNDFIISSKILILGNLTLLIGVVFVTAYNLNIIFLALVYILFPVVLLSSFLAVFFKRYQKYHIRFNHFDYSETRNVFSFSMNIQGMSVFGALIDPVIKYILGNFYSLNTVSGYEIARRFATAISGLFNTTFRTILPKASRLHSKDDYRNFVLSQCVQLSEIGATYSVLIFGVGSIALAAVIKYWFHVEQAVIIFLILALPESLNNFGYSLYNFLIGIGKASVLMKIQILNLCIVSITLIAGYYLLGAGLGLLGYYITILLAISIMLITVQKQTSVPAKIFLKKSKFIKLLFFDVLLLSAILILNAKIAEIYLVLGLLSAISFLIYVREIVKYTKRIHLSFGKIDV